MNLYLLLFLLSLELISTISTPTCEDYSTCSACVLNNFDNCQWCSSKEYKGKRCQPKLINQQCNKIISRPKIEPGIIRNDGFSSGEQGGKLVQVKPQYVKIKSASLGVTVNISMSYKPAKDAPLDVYFLIDNSENIARYRNDLIDQAASIFETIKNYTNNVRLGIGTFIDKPALPFANPDKHNVYSFQNNLPLTNDTNLFKSTLKHIKPGTNYDPPENILDALVQSMLCKKSVGWRDEGRRIIVVFTNAFYHSVGDGKIIGAFKRNDMQCHEDDIDSQMDALMDYPSVGQVGKVVKDNGYVIIFAVEDNVRNHYKLLSQEIGAKYIKLIDENIAGMIRNEYVKIIENVDIAHNGSKHIQMTSKNFCDSADCKAMHFKPLELMVTLKVVSCPDSLNNKEIIKIGPKSLKQGLIVEVEYNCQCDCENDNETEFNSDKCNGAGDYQCGICKCKPNRSGDECECQSDLVNDKNDYEKCKRNANDTLRCSGHGECSCGKCGPCHKGFSGPFCEYNDNSCPRRGGKICSGHGDCKMGKCQCHSNWVDSPDGTEDCGCTLEQKSCIAPYSNKVCSGNGDCRCGVCTCNSMVDSNDTCTGRYCDNCKWFAEKRCEELQDFAYCHFLKKPSCKDEYNLTETRVVFANRSEINSPDNVEWYMANWCRVKKGEDESIFVFKYYYTPDENTNQRILNVVIQNELDEKPPADIWVTVGSSIGGILLIGLLSLLLWKVLTDIYDAREYNQFVKKAQAAGYDVTMTENPWYEPPVTTFINPAHADN